MCRGLGFRGVVCRGLGFRGSEKIRGVEYPCNSDTDLAVLVKQLAKEAEVQTP